MVSVQAVGIPRKCGRRPVAFEDRFWSKISKRDSDGCWLWTASVDSHGYSMFWWNGKTLHASRVLYERIHGPIPRGLYVLHRCDSPRWVRPDHLFLGTHQENMDDKVAKNRQARGDGHGLNLHPDRRTRGDRHWTRLRPQDRLCGERHGCAKLNEGKVRELRARYAAGGVTQRELAREYRITQAQVSLIIRRENWK